MPDLLRAPLVLWPALLVGVVLCVGFHRLASTERMPRALLVGVAALLALPWLAFLAYYTHMLDGPLYYEWRSWPLTDFTAGGVGALAGALAAGPDARRPRGTAGPARAAGVGGRPFGLGRGVAYTALLVILAFAKPALGLMHPEELNDVWVDGVCIQTSDASCGACTTATVLRALGEEGTTEREIAVAAATARTGTLNWLLAREVRARGYEARFTAPTNPWEAKPPAILGVTADGVGHFVVLLSVEGDRVVVGEPLSGREEMSWPEFGRRYRFETFALEIR